MSSTFEKLRENIRWFRNTHFFKHGLPFLTLVVGGSFAMIIVQRIKYDYKEEQVRRIPIRYKGKEMPVLDVDEEMAKVLESLPDDWSTYENVRGPRDYEENTEWERAREAQWKKLQEVAERSKPVKINDNK